MIEIPVEIINAFKSLSDDDSWIIFSYLMDGDKPLSEIKKLNVANLDMTLKDLTMGGLVRRYAKSLADIADDDKNYYGLTTVGRSLARWLIDFLGVEEGVKGITKEVKLQTIDAVWCNLHNQYMPVTYCMRHCGRFGGYVGFKLIKCKYEG